MNYYRKISQNVLVFTIALASPVIASADASYEALKQQVELMQKQLEQLQKALKTQQAQVEKVEKNTITRAEAQQLEQQVNAASEWKDPNTFVHMSGYADIGYTDAEGDNGSFGVGTFAPIFHFQYKDLFMLESELEFNVDDDGETSVALEYLTIDWFVNDYVALVGGKFLSPLGQFRQNLHPSWINKLASAPPGFGHDGAAPISELGLQARGGFPIGTMRTNYAVYVANGPELIAEWDGTEFELDGIDAEGKGTDSDGEKVWGGRFGVLPFAGLEFGISAATGKATVTSIEDGTGTAPALANEQARDYDVFGIDAAWQYKSFALRGEYIRSKIGSATTGTSASNSSVWKSSYVQASYLFPSTKFEGVTRYTDFNSPHNSQDQKQWAFGINYLFASNVIGKVTYELNDGQRGAIADNDRVLVQMAYGF